jgi:hypothetical protein
MDLFCPHCSRRVTVPDSSSGQVTSCPLCAKQFMTPSLAPPTAPPPSAPKPQPAETYGMGSPLPAPSPPMTQKTPPPIKPAAAPEPALPPPPPGDYAHSYVCHLKGTWLAFVPTACLVLIFVLTFFSWHYSVLTHGVWFWSLALTTEHGEGAFLAYFVLTLLSGPLAIAALVFDMGLIPAQPQLAPVMTWKNLIVGVFLTLAFAMLCIDFVIQHFAAAGNPIALAEEVAIRLHFLAVVASFLMFWLQLRKTSNKPLPKIEIRW